MTLEEQLRACAADSFTPSWCSALLTAAADANRELVAAIGKAVRILSDSELHEATRLVDARDALIAKMEGR